MKECSRRPDSWSVFTAGLALRGERRTSPLAHVTSGTHLVPEPPPTPFLPLGTPGPCLHTPMTPLFKALWPPPGSLPAPRCLPEPPGSLPTAWDQHNCFWGAGKLLQSVFLSHPCVDKCVSHCLLLHGVYHQAGMSRSPAGLLAPKGGSHAINALPPHCPTSAT